jgi:hypothetical protein
MVSFNIGPRAIPFNVHPPPPMDDVNKIWTPKKKIKVPTQTTPPPKKIKKFLPYPSEKTQRSKDADAHTQPLRNGFFKPPQKFSSIGGGVY